MKTRQVVDKKIELSLVGVGGNAFAILGVFKNRARRERWTAEEISIVIEEAMSDDYDHLLQTIIAHTV